MAARKLTHLDERGRARMVDVSAKAVTVREAVAEGFIIVGAETLAAISAGTVPKGEVLNTARVAGILAAKRTGELIPLCHPLGVESVEVNFEMPGKTPRGGRCADSHRSAGEDQREDRRGDGGSSGRERGGADDLRHVQGDRQGDGHRAGSADREDRGEIGLSCQISRATGRDRRLTQIPADERPAKPRGPELVHLGTARPNPCRLSSRRLGLRRIGFSEGVRHSLAANGRA